MLFTCVTHRNICLRRREEKKKKHNNKIGKQYFNRHILSLCAYFLVIIFIHDNYPFWFAPCQRQIGLHNIQQPQRSYESQTEVRFHVNSLNQITGINTFWPQLELVFYQRMLWKRDMKSSERDRPRSPRVVVSFCWPYFYRSLKLTINLRLVVTSFCMQSTFLIFLNKQWRGELDFRFRLLYAWLEPIFVPIFPRQFLFHPRLIQPW